MMTETKKDFVRKLKEITTLPTLLSNYHEIKMVVTNVDATVNDIARVVEKDPSFASTVLKVSNSAFYSFPTKIDSIRKAISLMGYREIVNIALTIDIINNFGLAKEMDIEKFWHHSVLVASLSKEIAKESTKVNSDTAYSVGLLHDIGVLVLIKFFPAVFKKLMSKVTPEKSIFDVEMQELGFTHIDITVEVMKIWNFLDIFYVPLANLWEPDQNELVAMRKLSLTVYKAHKIAESKDGSFAWDILPRSTVLLNVNIDVESNIAKVKEALPTFSVTKVSGGGGHMDAENVVIIGSGPAGYTAGIYAARANLSPLLFAGGQHGGQLMLTSDVENYPGFVDPIKGPDLMERFRKQAERVGCRVEFKDVTQVDFSTTPFKIFSGSDVYRTRAVIISTGAKSNWIGLDSEKALIGKGVTSCATCDGFFFKGKDVVVIGGGDSALEEALFLSNIVKSVTIIHRRDQLRASKIMQERALNKKNISFKWDSIVIEVKDVKQEKVTGVFIENIKTKQRTTLPCDGVFVAIGHTPNTDIFKGKIQLDEKGYIKTEPRSTMTSIDGVFASGDVVDHVYRQAITAAGLGCMAAIDCERWLEKHAVKG